MNESILNTIKHMIGLEEDDDSFDIDLIVNINSAFGVLKQIGLRDTNYSIKGPDEKWSDYFGESEEDFEMAKTYIYMKVRLWFDSPTGSALEAMKESIKEFEWRLNSEADY